MVALSSCRECAGPSQQPGGGAWAVVTIARSSGLRSCGCCTRLRLGSSFRGLFKSIQDKHVLSLDSSSDDLVGSQRGGIPGVGGRSIRRTDRSPSLDLGLLTLAFRSTGLSLAHPAMASAAAAASQVSSSLPIHPVLA